MKSFALIMLTCASLGAAELPPTGWVYDWTAAYPHERYERSAKAVKHLNAAIELLEKSESPLLMNLYFERGLALGSDHEYARAVADFTRVIDDQSAAPHVLSGAYWNRMVCFVHLKDIKSAKQDYRTYKERFWESPQVEMVDGFAVITGCLGFRRELRERLINSLLCLKESDYVRTTSGTVLVKLSEHALLAGPDYIRSTLLALIERAHLARNEDSVHHGIYISSSTLAESGLFD